MELQKRTASALLASNVSTILSSQNKLKTPVFQFSGNSNIHSYNKSLVRNRFALRTTKR